MPGRESLLDAARRAARTGSTVVLEAGGTIGSRRGRAKGPPGDYVTEVDLASERAIGAVLLAATPDIPILGEEQGASTGLGSRYWVVDPLDGTTNFLHGFPAVGVSVALIEDGAPVVGAVCAPFLSLTWSAAAGAGAMVEMDGDAPAPCAVSARIPEQAVVATGFPFRRKERLPRYLGAMHGALERFEDLRRPGAAALDLAWVADGTFDGFFELGLGTWDVAAGGLLIAEAGGVVSDWGGGSNWLAGDILAGPPRVHAELLTIAAS
jgi:myo-inositol-1(or 4)-monophosphatase